MDTTAVAMAAIAVVGTVLLVALARFRRVRFGLTVQDRGTLTLAASHDERARPGKDITIGRLESRDGSIEALADDGISGDSWRAAKDVKLIAGRSVR